MNIARWPSLLLDAFFFELCCFGVLDIVGDVRIAIVCARIDVQELFGGDRAGKIRVQLERTREPGANVSTPNLGF